MKKLILIIAILFACSFTLQAQDFRFVSWEDVDYYSTSGYFFEYDKLDHLVGSMGLCAAFEFLSEEHGWKYALLCGVLWEVKDGFFDCEVYGDWGGEGFDLFGDLAADAAGIGIWKGLCWVWDAIMGVVYR